MFEAVSDAICLLVFLVLSGLVARARQEPSRWRLVLAGSLATALWAAAALAAAAGIVPRLVPALAEVLRNLAWLHLLAACAVDHEAKLVGNHAKVGDARKGWRRGRLQQCLYDAA